MRLYHNVFNGSQYCSHVIIEAIDMIAVQSLLGILIEAVGWDRMAKAHSVINF